MADMTLDELRARLHPTGDDGEWFARDELALMVDGIDAAIKQREQDAKDTARLDWMDAHPRLATIVIDGHPTECYFYGVSGAAGLKLREIIDVAMAKESGNE